LWAFCAVSRRTGLMPTVNPMRPLFLGAVLGFVFAVLPSACGNTGAGSTRCTASNCDGCCDETSMCQRGTSGQLCGSNGKTCVPCLAGQTCMPKTADSVFGGVCSGEATGGGSGATGVGAMDGGTAATGGGSGTCDSNTCPTGCCSDTNVCITQIAAARCGTGGQRCVMCPSANTCVNGACTACNGCVDGSNGRCEVGTANAQCGRAGGVCATCDSSTGQTCQAGVCQGGTQCNASTCAGCCDGNACKLPAMYSNAQCGQGVAGAACVACAGTCDGNSGTCVGGGGTGGGGGGLPGLPSLDGGLCALVGFPCGPTDCCDFSAFIPLLPACYRQGATCGNGVKVCGAGNVCQ
jgi:hypothetical protein